MSWVAHLSFINVAEGAEINVLVSADKITEGSTLSSSGSRAAIDSSALDNATLQQSVDSFTICMRLKFRDDTSMTPHCHTQTTLATFCVLRNCFSLGYPLP